MLSTILTGWAILSLPVALLIGRCIELPNRAAPCDPEPAQPAAAAEPNVATDHHWLDDQPPEITLTRTEVDLRIRDLEHAETWTTS